MTRRFRVDDHTQVAIGSSLFPGGEEFAFIEDRGLGVFVGSRLTHEAPLSDAVASLGSWIVNGWVVEQS